MDSVASVVLLLILLACVYGTLGRRFDDNLLQRLGMASMGLGALAELWHITQAGEQITRGELAIYCGVLAFAVGIAIKVRHFWRVEQRYQRPRAVR